MNAGTSGLISAYADECMVDGIRTALAGFHRVPGDVSSTDIGGDQGSAFLVENPRSTGQQGKDNFVWTSNSKQSS